MSYVRTNISSKNKYSCEKECLDDKTYDNINNNECLKNVVLLKFLIIDVN